MQIATRLSQQRGTSSKLCLHTLRADCNSIGGFSGNHLQDLHQHAQCRLQHRRNMTPRECKFFASTRSVQIATTRLSMMRGCIPFASTRSVQIATATTRPTRPTARFLCLHTLRADCNAAPSAASIGSSPLPPHAPCRLQRLSVAQLIVDSVFASTRSVQIATQLAVLAFRVGVFASTRSVQIATACAFINKE